MWYETSRDTAGRPDDGLCDTSAGKLLLYPSILLSETCRLVRIFFILQHAEDFHPSLPSTHQSAVKIGSERAALTQESRRICHDGLAITCHASSREAQLRMIQMVMEGDKASLTGTAEQKARSAIRC